MHVFVTGATGYIGSRVARKLRRAGHVVHGLVRNPAKVQELERYEIEPVVGTLQDPAGWRGAARDCAVLIHAALDPAADTFDLDRATVRTLIEIAGGEARLKTLIYTSGVWVHGDTGGRTVDETTALAPARLVAPRVENERLVLEAASVRGIVLRPGCVYGDAGGLTSAWFKGASEGTLQAIGDGTNHWAMVHVNDVADAYLRAAESDLAGEAFTLVDGSQASVREMVEAAARAAGFAGTIHWISVAEATKTMGPFAECLALDQRIDARKALRRLGWQPRHGGFVDEVATYFRAWKAAQD